MDSTSDQRPIYIYGLADPDTGEIRYIGKSIRVYDRLSNHCNDRSRNHRTNWIKTLLQVGKKPALVILEELPHDADWQDSERRWIAHARSNGWRLTNGTDGGDGLMNPPEEVREKIRATWVGRKHSPETLAKYSEMRKGKLHSDEWKQNMSQVMKGREITWGHKLSLALRKLTDDDVREIRVLLAGGVKQLRIAGWYGVDKGTISNIKRGVSYGDVQ